MQKYLYYIALIMLTIACTSSKPNSVANPAFEFRALCTPSNNEPKKWDITMSHNIDNDWGLWGHNLWKVIGKNPPKEVYAMIDGKRDTTQYCFSSPKLYGIVEEWIIDQWGMKGGRFHVMPADNKKVCTCELCTSKGNTSDNATPAVADMLTRLARKFPGHQFFITAYHSTLTPPSKALPKNAGVMLSTIDIPLRCNFKENKGFRKFDGMLKGWQKVASLVYVWDYERNFDDYLTPFPCLMPMQERLRYFREAGIKGVFINGSGYDYSSFDNVQSYVLSRLLVNPDEDVVALVQKFYDRYFPKCGKFIAAYYLALENRVRETNHILPFYGTMAEMQEAYLEDWEFNEFWIELDRRSKSVEGPERKLLNQMLTAFAYTRLQLHPSEDDRAELLLILKDYKSVPGLLNYKETDGSLEQYLTNH